MQHDVMQSCEIIFVAVKPFYMNGVLDNVKEKVTKEHLIVSVAAGYSLDQMAEHLPPETRIVRVMPNTPSLVGAGASGFCLGSHATADDASTIKTLMESVGIAHQVSEK